MQTGSEVEILIQNTIVAHTVSVQGYRWHHAVHRSVMHAIVRASTIAMGGKFVHWDALDARSPDSGKSEKLLVNLSNSHFHAHQQHRDIVRRCVADLFKTTAEKEINAVKWIVFGTEAGMSILRDPGVITGEVVGLDSDHPVITALSKVPLPSCYTQRVLFETPKCPANVSTVLHNRTTPEQQILADRGVTGVRLGCQILCDHDMEVRVISRLEGSGRKDCGSPMAAEIEPPAEWVDKA